MGDIGPRRLAMRVAGSLRLLALVLAILAVGLSIAAPPVGASIAVADDGSLGAARFSYDASVDTVLGPIVEPTGWEARVDQPASADAIDVGPFGHTCESSARFVAPSGALSRVDDVIAETNSATTRNITSRITLSADEALEAGQRWVGTGYTEIGKPGSGVFLSSDGLRRFRIDNGLLAGSHQPGVPHVHLELFANPGDKVALVNNHIPFLD